MAGEHTSSNVLIEGFRFNDALRDLTGNDLGSIRHLAIVRGTPDPAVGLLVSDPDGPFPVHAAYDPSTSTVTLTSEADVLRVNPNANGMFYACSGLVEPPDAGLLDTSSVVTAERMFYGCMGMVEDLDLGKCDMSLLEDAESMYGGCSSLSKASPLVGLGSLRTSKLMYSGCTSLKKSPKMRDLPCLEDASGMFCGDTGLTVPADLVDLPRLTDVCSMYERCTGLARPAVMRDLPRLEVASYLYFRCTSLSEPPVLDSDELPLLTYVDGLCDSCTSLIEAVDLVGFQRLDDATCMHSGCVGLVAAGEIRDCPALVSVECMYDYCDALVTPARIEGVPSLRDMDGMYRGCPNVDVAEAAAQLGIDGTEAMEAVFPDCGLSSSDVSRPTTVPYVDPYGHEWDILLARGEHGGRLAVEMYNVSDGYLEPFAAISVNLPAQGLPDDASRPDCAFVDTNNLGDVVGWLEDNGLAETIRDAAGNPMVGESGLCLYPAVRFTDKFFEVSTTFERDEPRSQPYEPEQGPEREDTAQSVDQGLGD